MLRVRELPLSVVLSCEHATRRVPAAYRAAFRSARAQRLLQSHRGWDPGSAPVARALARRLPAPLLEAEVSRLLVECNRSPSHPALFSELSGRLPAEQKARLLARYYHPHRDRVESAVRAALALGRVLHLGVHSFTDRLGGERRAADVGLLYDPARPLERALGACWAKELAARLPALRIRRNYPYRGNADGLTTSFRRSMPRGYLGFELELRQGLLQRLSGAERGWLTEQLAESLVEAAFRLPPSPARVTRAKRARRAALPG